MTFTTSSVNTSSVKAVFKSISKLRLKMVKWFKLTACKLAVIKSLPEKMWRLVGLKRYSRSICVSKKIF
jgi:hypothetical protein